MKVAMLGVCLQYRQHNYGSKLQALATVRMFDILKKEYQIIRYNKKTVLFVLKYLLRFFNPVFLNDRFEQVQREVAYRKHSEIKEKAEIRKQAFDAFDQYFEKNLSEVFPSYRVLQHECIHKYESIITCSDQLWSPSALGSGFYNLMFAPEETKKISWASSFGVSEIPWYQKKRTQKYLNRIQYISIRENRGAEIVKELTGKNVPVLMDPVFVFDKEEWEELIPPTKSEWDDYIFCYFLGENSEHRKAARELAERTGLKIVTLRHLDRYVAEDETFGDYAPYDVDPARFLNILRNARYVCTDSFHGSAFSILCEKPFVVFDRYSSNASYSKNSRIDSLCENLGLQDRRFTTNKDIAVQMEQEIDYEAVNRRLEDYRTATKRYLKDALL